MKTLALVNQKGGVGKTTTAINLAACLAAAERKTLVIDLDPQGNATSGLGFSKHQLSQSMYDVLVNNLAMEEIIQKTSLEYLDIAPANTQLVGAELELVSALSRENRLTNALKKLTISYDYVLIDCPPSLGLLTLNALTASQGVLVPVQCEYYAMEGLSELIKTVELVQNHLNPEIGIQGILLTMYDGRNNLARQVESEVRSFFGDKVYQNVIPRNVKLSESPSHGKSIILYDAQSKGAVSYLNWTAELLRREEGLQNPAAEPTKDDPELGEQTDKIQLKELGTALEVEETEISNLKVV